MHEHHKRTMLVISRHWDNPHISVSVSDERIALEMPVEDFIKALVKDAKHPIGVHTRKQLESELLKALEVVVPKIKEASAAVV